MPLCVNRNVRLATIMVWMFEILIFSFANNASTHKNLLMFYYQIGLISTLFIAFVIELIVTICKGKFADQETTCNYHLAPLFIFIAFLATTITALI